MLCLSKSLLTVFPPAPAGSQSWPPHGRRVGLRVRGVPLACLEEGDTFRALSNGGRPWARQSALHTLLYLILAAPVCGGCWDAHFVGEELGLREVK